MNKGIKEESSFRTPPLWIHVSEAGKWLLSRREAKKRAVIRLLDRVSMAGSKVGSKIRGQGTSGKTGV